MSDEKITINVDGVDHEVGRNQQLIQALREAGVDTPHFCFHDDLSVAGNCRICLVEVEGPRGWALMISCYLRPAPGMKVRTDATSEKVVDARKGVMEFLLVNHPLDCPICDKAGECTLQEHYMSSGRHESRLEDEVGKVYKGAPDFRFVDTRGVERGGKNIDLGPTIVLDQERCILCSRCVRFMDEVAGEEQLYLAGRGDTAYLTTFPGEPLDHDYDLCTTDICPVGALTGKHFRFQQRVWFLKKTESIAPDDSLGANLTIEHHGDRVWRLMPRRNPEVNRSWLHNDTRLLYRELDRDRLVEGRLGDDDAPLAEALYRAGETLSRTSRVAVVISGHLTCEDIAAGLALAAGLGERAEVFGGSWLPVGEGDGIARSGDPVANRRGAELAGVPDNLDDLCARADEFECLLVIGHDLWGIDPERAAPLEGIRERIVLASWRDETVARARIAIGVRAWAEVRGTMINCHDRVQLMQACPVCPNPELEPIWQTVCRLATAAGAAPIPWMGEVDAWRTFRERVPRLEGIGYAQIGPMGVLLGEDRGSLLDEMVELEAGA